MLEVYYFTDKDGNLDGYTTEDPIEAKEYAKAWELVWCVNIYKFSDSEVVEDFTVEDTEEDEEIDDVDIPEEDIPEILGMLDD